MTPGIYGQFSTINLENLVKYRSWPRTSRAVSNHQSEYNNSQDYIGYDPGHLGQYPTINLNPQINFLNPTLRPNLQPNSDDSVCHVIDRCKNLGST